MKIIYLATKKSIQISSTIFLSVRLFQNFLLHYTTVILFLNEYNINDFLHYWELKLFKYLQNKWHNKNILLYLSTSTNFVYNTEPCSYFFFHLM